MSVRNIKEWLNTCVANGLVLTQKTAVVDMGNYITDDVELHNYITDITSLKTELVRYEKGVRSLRKYSAELETFLAVFNSKTDKYLADISQQITHATTLISECNSALTKIRYIPNSVNGALADVVMDIIINATVMGFEIDELVAFLEMDIPNFIYDCYGVQDKLI